jgi:hypothetical protein
MKHPAWIAAALFAALDPAPRAPQGATPPPPPRPVEAFADLEGTWAGTFVGWDAEGRELYRLRVRQTYRTLDDTTQAVEIEDRADGGAVVTGRGTNVARRLPDGTLELTCTLERSNGERVRHRGRAVRGPDGDPEIVWSSSSQERSETFRERVQREGTLEVYAIDGMGRYGGGLVLMAGRYVKQP